MFMDGIAPIMGVSEMSSLRVETLRLCWLEAFIAVADAENISEAANNLVLDQSTVSRYMQALAKWAGKELIKVGAVVDPEDARASVAITEEGQQLYTLAKRIISELTNFRHESALRSEVIDSMDRMVSSMEKDRKLKVTLPVTLQARDGIDSYRRFISNLTDAVPMGFINPVHGMLRPFFNAYEWQRNKDKRRSGKKTTPAPDIPIEWFEARLTLPSSDFTTKLGNDKQGQDAEASKRLDLENADER